MALCIKPRISLFRYVAEQTRHRGVGVPHRVPLAEASTNGNFQALRLPPGAMPTKPVSPSTDLDGAMASPQDSVEMLIIVVVLGCAVIVLVAYLLSGRWLQR
jgi:hypothetical protein